MEPLILFACLFLPTFALSMLSASRDQMLFQTRPALHLGVVTLLTLTGAAVLHVFGLSWSWALALTTSGLLGSRLGDWFGRGGWIILRFRLERLLGHS